MPHYNIQQLEGMRGFNALTQDKDEVKVLLVRNVNALNGKKFIGFKKTRIEVQQTDFDKEALVELVDMLKDVDCDKPLCSFVAKVMKNLLEKVLRDHVAVDMAVTFAKCIAQRIELNNGDIEATVEQVEKYCTCGTVVSVAESFRQAEEELQEGMVIYYEPTTTSKC